MTSNKRTYSAVRYRRTEGAKQQKHLSAAWANYRGFRFFSLGKTNSQHYRKAQARDGINEMHPDVLNRRISNQESGEMEAAAAQVLAAEAAEGDGVVGVRTPKLLLLVVVAVFAVVGLG